MSLPLNIPDLAINDDRAGNAEDGKQRLQAAAETVEAFARQSSLAALDAALSLVATDSPDAAAQAAAAAEESTEKAAMLQAEVERFLATAPKS